MHFYAAEGPTQHKFILLSKTNLSPAQETLENAADAVDRMKETKTFSAGLWSLDICSFVFRDSAPKARYQDSLGQAKAGFGP